jgi:hypothetical protein
MYSKSRLQILKHLDISLWEPRSDFLFLDKPQIFARLAIFLTEPLKPENQEEKKILTGMLSVLGLKREEYWLGWIAKDTGEWTKEAFWQAIQVWKPTTILFLGQHWVSKLRLASFSDFPADSDSQNSESSNSHALAGSDPHSFVGSDYSVHATFHPKELIKMPDKKKKAYQSLLNLKHNLTSVL